MLLKETIAALSARDGGRYALEAYLFVMEVVVSAVARRNRTRCEHVPADEFMEVFLREVLQKFGPYGWGVLNGWGIFGARDVGEIVFKLSEGGLISVSEEDRLDSFGRAMDLKSRLELPAAQGPRGPLPLIVDVCEEK